MTFRDIFKSSFLENMDSVPLLDMAIALVLSFLLGLFIFAIYKQCYAGVMYSPSFGVTLVALSLITTLLILTVVSNIVLSLGMVGALSIVRFRTAVKEPMDIAFLFWAIAVGIVLAAACSLGWYCWLSPSARGRRRPTSSFSTARGSRRNSWPGPLWPPR